MKKGLSIVELAQEIERQANSKRDFVADTRKIEMVPTEATGEKKPGVELVLWNGGENPLIRAGANKVAHNQIAEHTGVPVKYYDRMLEQKPELLARNVNTWLKEQPAKRMVRTLDGNARAFLSDRYRPLENNDLAEAVLPPLLNMGVEIISSQITEKRLYIKAIDHRIARDIPYGHKLGDGSHKFFDTMSPAIVISNSEVGLGMLSVETAVYTKMCTNLAVASERSLRKYHVGGRSGLAEGLVELLSDKTKRITDAAMWSQVRDVVTGAFEKARFDAYVDQVQGMTEQKIEGDPIKAVELAQRKFSLTEAEGKSVLRHLIEGADLSRYGLFNAITRTAEDLGDYDRATEFERLGGAVVELPAHDWKEIAAAA
jgi:hypothetical protein